MLYKIGSILILILFFSLLIVLLKRVKCESNRDEDKQFLVYLVVSFILWLLISITVFQAVYKYFREDHHSQTLAYPRDVYHRGLIQAKYGIYDYDHKKNKLYFDDFENKKLLVLKELSQMGSGEKEKFSVFILVKDGNFDELKEILVGSKFNGCTIEQIRNNIRVYGNYKLVNGFELSPGCLKGENNFIELKQQSPDLYKDSLSLYLVNKKVDYLYASSKKSIVNFAAITGGTFLVLEFVFVVNLLKKMKT